MLEERYLFALGEVFGMGDARDGKFRLELLWVGGGGGLLDHLDTPELRATAEDCPSRRVLQHDN